MGGDGRRRWTLARVRSAAASTAAQLQAVRLSLPGFLLLATATFVLGRLSGGLETGLVRGAPVPPSGAHPPQPHALQARLQPSFADASHQAALLEEHVARREAVEGEAGAQAQAEAPAPRLPLEAGASGNAHISTIPFQVLSWEPRAVFFPGFLDAERCRAIVELAAKRLGPSSLALRAGDTLEGTQDVRTSMGTFVTRREHAALEYLEDRIAEATLIPAHHGEPFNVLRYEIGQKYDSHYDTFDPESYGPQPSQRIISFLIYLNEWEEGGETVFLLEGADGLARLVNINYRSCESGLRVKPLRTGDALLFHNIYPNQTFDKHALHGGCPVKKGTKWVGASCAPQPPPAPRLGSRLLSLC